MASTDSCYSCKFYMAATKSGMSGMCRRFPPSFRGELQAYPNVYKDDWCGEYLFIDESSIIERNYKAPFSELVDLVSKAD